MIHLVHMPFGSILRPPLALGLFKAQLRQAGLAVLSTLLLHDGGELAEVAKEVGVSERTVRRLRDRLLPGLAP